VSITDCEKERQDFFEEKMIYAELKMKQKQG
jgi:hypothetical protein